MAGETVALDPRARSVRFLCDVMLGKLAKRLRAAGYDAIFAGDLPDTSDRSLVERAIVEGRILLTCDGGFSERAPVRDGEVAFLKLPQNLSVEEQLEIVADHFGLCRLPSRCMVCGGELDTVSLSEVADEVPPGVAEHHGEFFRCQSCGRVFWHGSHRARISARLESVFGGRYCS